MVGLIIVEMYFKNIFQAGEASIKIDLAFGLLVGKFNVVNLLGA